MTIRQIAEKFGVAPSTVSVVLNNRPGVRKEMREKIAESLIANGYTIKNNQPEKKGTILFIYYQSTNYLAARKDNTISSILSGIEEICSKSSYKYFVANATDKSLEHIIRNASSEYCGIILLGTEYYTEPLDFIIHSPVPIVVLDGYFPEYPLNTVNMDNSFGIHQALSYLAENGHKQIGYLKSKIEFGCLRDRTSCILSSLKLLGYGDPFCIISVSQEPSKIEMEIKSYLDSGRPVPTAFIADNDIIAVSAMQTFQAAGYKIPEDISIIGFDNSEICTIITPHLTTIKASVHEMARQAAIRLIELVEEKPKNFIRYKVGTHLIKRETVTRASDEIASE
ncbi:MAG: LacI family DNA-binding transcriptional regulator [Bilifractor sp.]|jgi:DNA-binding LacI/PurR family transcriptional regulator